MRKRENYFTERCNQEQELRKLPIRCDTLRAKAKREELEKNLFRIEEQLETFSKPKVYIPIENDQAHKSYAANY